MKVRSALLALVVVFAGCSSNNSTPTSDGAPDANLEDSRSNLEDSRLAGQSGVLITAARGGVVVSDDGLAILRIPAQALTADMRISIEKQELGDLSDELKAIAPAGVYRLYPAGLEFLRPAALSFRLPHKLDATGAFALPTISSYSESTGLVPLGTYKDGVHGDHDVRMDFSRDHVDVTTTVKHFSLWIHHEGCLEVTVEKLPQAIDTGAAFSAKFKFGVRAKCTDKPATYVIDEIAGQSSGQVTSTYTHPQFSLALAQRPAPVEVPATFQCNAMPGAGAYGIKFRAYIDTSEQPGSYGNVPVMHGALVWDIERFPKRVPKPELGQWTFTANFGASILCAKYDQVGACCFEGPYGRGCVDTAETECQISYRGSYLPVSSCRNLPCEPTGACCKADLSCDQSVPEGFCSGTWYRGQSCPDTACEDDFKPGACCKVDGQCQTTSKSRCAGTFNLGKTCKEAACKDKRGACCRPDGTCIDGPSTFCRSADEFHLQGQTCSDGKCPQTDPGGACCGGGGACVATTATKCDGKYLAGQQCHPALCPKNVGACCYDDGHCREVDKGVCLHGATFNAGKSCGEITCKEKHHGCGSKEIQGCSSDGDCPAIRACRQGQGPYCDCECSTDKGAACESDADCPKGSCDSIHSCQCSCDKAKGASCENDTDCPGSSCDLKSCTCVTAQSCTTEPALASAWSIGTFLALSVQQFCLARLAVTIVELLHSAASVGKKPVANDHTTITNYVALVQTFTKSAIDALFNNSVFDCGTGPNGYTICPASPQVVPAGDFIVVATVVEKSVPLADGTKTYQYAFVFDADGDTANNYQPAAAYPNDFFKDTDLWFEAAYVPGSGWSLKATSAVGGSIQPVATKARIIIKGNALVLVVPASEFSVAKPEFRVTAFSHGGDYGIPTPHVYDGSVWPAVASGLQSFP